MPIQPATPLVTVKGIPCLSDAADIFPILLQQLNMNNNRLPEKGVE